MDAYIRWMIVSDLPEVVSIDVACFEHAWSEDELRKHLRSRNYIGMVADDQRGSVLGYMVYELHKFRLQIIRLAVMPTYHREGIGRAMVTRLIDKLSFQRRTRIAMEVRDSNLDGQLFLHALGFKAISVLKERYEDTGEDAYLFQYSIRACKEVDSDLINKVNQ